jgi:hypothetical protein
MSATWIAMLLIWAIVEFIQYLRKSPFPGRMATGAYWGVGVSTLMSIGYLPHEQATGLRMLIALAITACGAAVVYGVRVAAGKLWGRVFEN